MQQSANRWTVLFRTVKRVLIRNVGISDLINVFSHCVGHNKFYSCLFQIDSTSRAQVMLCLFLNFVATATYTRLYCIAFMVRYSFASLWLVLTALYSRRDGQAELIWVVAYLPRCFGPTYGNYPLPLRQKNCRKCHKLNIKL